MNSKISSFIRCVVASYTTTCMYLSNLSHYLRLAPVIRGNGENVLSICCFYVLSGTLCVDLIGVRDKNYVLCTLCEKGTM